MYPRIDIKMAIPSAVGIKNAGVGALNKIAYDDSLFKESASMPRQQPFAHQADQFKQVHAHNLYLAQTHNIT